MNECQAEVCIINVNNNNKKKHCIKKDMKYSDIFNNVNIALVGVSGIKHIVPPPSALDIPTCPLFPYKHQI